MWGILPAMDMAGFSPARECWPDLCQLLNVVNAPVFAYRVAVGHAGDVAAGLLQQIDHQGVEHVLAEVAERSAAKVVGQGFREVPVRAQPRLKNMLRHYWRLASQAANV